MVGLILSAISVIAFLILGYGAIMAAREDHFKIASSWGLSSIAALVLSVIFLPDNNLVYHQYIVPYYIEWIVGYLIFGVISIYFGWASYCKNAIILKKKYEVDKKTKTYSNKDLNGYAIYSSTPYRFPLNPYERKAIIVTYFLGYPIYILEYAIETSWNIIKGIKSPFVTIGKGLVKVFGPSLTKLSTNISNKYDK